MDFLNDILGKLEGGFADSDNVPNIITEFGRILYDIISAIMSFLKQIGFGGSDDDTTTTTA